MYDKMLYYQLGSSEKKYVKLTQVEHILKRPSMYIGKIVPVEVNTWILNDTKDKMDKKLITFSLGLYKLFDEIIINSLDESKEDNTLTKIKVEYNEKTGKISVYNNGKGIPVTIHKEYKVYNPELIFGHLMTSSHYEDTETKRTTGGVFGLGAKLVNVFSKYFKVEVGDPVNKKSFTQVFKNNLSEKSEPIIGDYDKKDGYVKITYVPDYKYFGIKSIDEFNISRIIKRTYEIASLASKNVTVHLNGEQVPVNTFEKYVNLYIDDKPRIAISKKRWEVIVCSSLDEKFGDISFVNGIYTSHGGKHVDYIMKQIINFLSKYIEKKYKISKIRESYIKDRFWLFLNCTIENPIFSSQTKEEMITNPVDFGSTFILPDSFYKKIIAELDIVDKIVSYIKYKNQEKLIKHVGKKSDRLYIDKLDDANWAGSNQSTKCTLILTEGDSAKSMAVSGLGAIKNGRDMFGIFPLRGKLLNVREATHKQIINNIELKNIIKILGLRINKKYNIDNLHELRYGRILLMMDADYDGSHIKGLLINLIDHFWPSLLKINGFIKVLVTPVVKVTKNDTVISFNTIKDYKVWEKKNDVNKWKIKYYKGLGTNTSKEAKEYFENIKENTINFVYNDEKDTEAIELAFSKQKIPDRKEWLKKYDKNVIVDNNDDLSYADFINKELIHFSNYDNVRSIPNICDGFKPSQRKILFSAFKRNLITDIKVLQFVGYVSEHSSYHHGENSLIEAVISMAQNFVGSNNVNLFVPNGQFGTRLLGGKDHSSARYIFTHLNGITKYIFKNDDNYVLNYLEDDGKMIEPDYYMPVIPMILVNGSEGIGTGYSTTIPKYNHNEIIDSFINKIKDGVEFGRLHPWYNKFEGRIIQIDDTSYLSRGIYKILDNKYIEVTELPIGMWTHKYKEFLEDIIIKYKKKIIVNYKNNSTEDKVYFLLKVANMKAIKKMENTIDENDVSKFEKQFKLVKSINTSNMYLYDSDSKLRKYENVEMIMDDFYNVRLHYYDVRKKFLLRKLEYEYNILKSKVNFIQEIIEKTLILSNKTKQNIIDELEKKGYFRSNDGYEYLINMPFYSLSKEKVKELNDKYNEKKKEFSILKKKDIKELWLDDLMELKKNI